MENTCIFVPCGTFFMIKSYVEENTSHIVRINKLASSSWIFDKLDDEIRKNLAMTMAYLAEKLKELYGLIDLSYANI